MALKKPETGIMAIMGAMPEEVLLLRSKIQSPREYKYAGSTFILGRYKNRSVVLSKCGIGKVNAAICTQLLVDKFSPNGIIFTGVAGGLLPHMDIGDLVISSHSVQHDFDLTRFGRRAGFVPRPDPIENIDQSLIARLKTSYGINIDALVGGVRMVEADSALCDIACRAYDRLRSETRSGEADFPNLFVGVVASGDKFIASREELSRLQRSFGAVCTEMEGAAVAYTCYVNSVPHVIIRAISDKADGSATVDFNTFVKRSATLSSKLVLLMLNLLFKKESQI